MLQAASIGARDASAMQVVLQAAQKHAKCYHTALRLECRTVQHALKMKAMLRNCLRDELPAARRKTEHADAACL